MKVEEMEMEREAATRELGALRKEKDFVECERDWLLGKLQRPKRV